MKVTGDTICLCDRLISLQVYFLRLQAAPEPFDEEVVPEEPTTAKRRRPSLSCSGEWLESLRVFGRLPDTDARECTEAGVRNASREETAGEFAPTLVSVYVEFAAAA